MLFKSIGPGPDGESKVSKEGFGRITGAGFLGIFTEKAPGSRLMVGKLFVIEVDD